MIGPGAGNDPPYTRSSGPDDEVAVVSSAIRDAIQYVETELGPEREEATKFYHGLPFGNEEDGRSKAILTEVRDGILGAIPSIVRVLHGPEHTVEFVPKTAQGVAAAEQATDYVRYIYEEDNAGFLTTHSTIKDGLLKRIGIVKWGMDETPEVRSTLYQGLTREDVALLAQEEGIELTYAIQQGEDSFDVEVSRTELIGKAWVMPVPPDDFFWNREARSLDDTLLVGHRTRLTKADLLKMGVTEKQIEEYGGSEEAPTTEEVARRLTNDPAHDTPMGEENRRYIYCEAYVKLGSELRKVCTLGNGYQIIKNVPADHRPFAFFTPDPEPHAMLGGSWFHLLKDTQLINSQLMRGMLDSLSVSLFPRPIYVDGQASVADILNTAIGAPVRERQPGMVRWDAAPFTGEKVMPLMGFMREVIERRIGQKDGAGSLDMDALQSTGKEAVNAAILAAQSQVELLTRLYCEQVFKPMYRGLLRIATHPKSKARLMRLRGQYIPVQPASWDASMDVRVNVALGTMNAEKKIAVLREVVADQTGILAEYGPENPVVKLHMLRNAKAKILALNGVPDVENYYLPVPDDYQPPPPPPPEPTEDEKWRQAEAQMAQEKAMKDLAIKQDELALRARELELKEAQQVIDRDLRMRELELRERDSIRDDTTGPFNADIERYKADMTAQNVRAQIDSNERIALAKLALEREKMGLDAGIARLKADTDLEVAAMTPEPTEPASE